MSSSSVNAEDRNLRDLLAKLSENFIKLVEARYFVELSNYSPVIIRKVDDKIHLMYTQMASLCEELNYRPKKALELMKNFCKAFNVDFAAIVSSSPKVFIRLISSDVSNMDSDSEVKNNQEIEIGAEYINYIFPNFCKKCNTSKKTKCIMEKHVKESTVYRKASSFFRSKTHLPLSTSEAFIVTPDSKNNGSNYRLYKNFYFLDKECSSNNSSLLTECYEDGVIIIDQCEIITNDENNVQNLVTNESIHGIRRNLAISLTGHLLKESLLTKDPIKNILAAKLLEVLKSGRLVKKVITEASIKHCYRIDPPNEQTQYYITREPNYRTILIDSFRRDLCRILVINSQFVILRKVKTSKGIKSLNKTFIEPIYVELKTNNESLNSMQSHTSKQNDDDSNTKDVSINPQNSSSHKHIIIYFLDKINDNVVLRGLSVRIVDLRVSIRKIADYLTVSECKSMHSRQQEDQKSTEDGEDADECVAQVVQDRGTSMVVKLLNNKPKSDKTYDFNITEYFTEDNCLIKAKNLQAKSKSDYKIRFTSDPKKVDKKTFYKVESEKNEGIINKMELISESKIRELIEQPELNKIIKIITSDYNDFPKEISKKQILSSNKNVSFLTKIDFKMFERDLDSDPVSNGSIIVNNSCKLDNTIKLKALLKAKPSDELKFKMLNLKGAYMYNNDMIHFDSNYKLGLEEINENSKVFIKNIIFDIETLKIKGEVDIKASLSSSLSSEYVTENEDRDIIKLKNTGQIWGPLVETQDIKDRRVRVTTYSSTIVTEHVVFLNDKTVLVVKETEPNYEAIIQRRIKSSAEVNDIFKINKAIDLNFENVQKYFSKDDHSSECTIFNKCCFLIKSRIRYFSVPIKTKLVEIDKLDSIDDLELIKFVNVFCEKCKYGPTYLLMQDDECDRVSLTLNKQILSPLDLTIALNYLLDAAHWMHDDEDRKMILKRFKTRIQRYMNHGIVGCSSKHTLESQEPSIAKKIEISKQIKQSQSQKPNDDPDEDIDDEADDKNRDENGLQLKLMEHEISSVKQVNSSVQLNLTSTCDFRNKIKDLATNIQSLLQIKLHSLEVLNENRAISEALDIQINAMQSKLYSLVIQVNQEIQNGNSNLGILFKKKKIENEFGKCISKNDNTDVIKLINDLKEKITEVSKDFAEFINSEYSELFIYKCTLCKNENKIYCVINHFDPNSVIIPADSVLPISTLDFVTIEQSKNNPGKYLFTLKLNCFSVMEILDDRPIVRNYSGGKIMQLTLSILPDNLDIENFVKEEKEIESNSDIKKEVFGDLKQDVPLKCSFLMKLKMSSNGHFAFERLERLNNFDNAASWDDLCRLKNVEFLQRYTSETRHNTSLIWNEAQDNNVLIDETLPNLSTIVRDVVKTNGRPVYLIISNFITIRKVIVKVTKNGHTEHHLFYEPIYNGIVPEKKLSKDIRDSLCKTIQGTSNSNGIKESETYETKPENDTHLNFRIYLFDYQTNKGKYLISSCIRNDQDVKESLMKCIANLQYAEIIANDLSFPNINDKLDLLKIIDRGISKNLHYSLLKENFYTHFEEFYMETGILTQMKKAVQVNSSNCAGIRFSSNHIPKLSPIKLKEKFDDCIDFVDDGITCSYKLVRKHDQVLIEEIIEEPSMKAILNWILQLPKAKCYTGKSLLIQTRQTSFYIVRNRNFICAKQTELPPCRSQLIRVSCENEIIEDYDSVSKLKQNIADISLFKGIYKLKQRSTTIQFNLDSKMERELINKYRQCESSTKDIVKFCLFDETSRIIADMEMKSKIVEKSGFAGIVERERHLNQFIINSLQPERLNCKYSEKFELNPQCIVTLIEEQISIIKTTKVFLSNDGERAIVVEVTEPNILAILIYRAMMSKNQSYLDKLKNNSIFHNIEQATFSKYFKNDSIIKHRDKVNIPISRTDKCCLDCPFANLGNFAIKSYIEVKEIIYIHQPDHVENRCETIETREELKLVQCLCVKCKNAQVILQNSDILGDAVVCTLRNQILSPLDLHEAIYSMLKNSKRANIADWPKIMTRFKHRIQRCMAHGHKG